MIHCFLGLGHHSVVGGDDEDDEVGSLRTSSAHRGERFVARRVEKDHGAPGRIDAIGTNVLGDAARLTAHDIGFADLVEQGCLSVVDVTHHRDDRWSCGLVSREVLELASRIADDVFFGARDVFDLVVELARKNGRRVGIEGAIDMHAGHAELHELHEDIGSLEAHALGQRLKLNLIFDADHALLRARHGDLGLLGLLSRLHALLTGPPLRPTRGSDRRPATDLTTARRIGSLLSMLCNDALTRALRKRGRARCDGFAPAHHARGQRVVSEAPLRLVPRLDRCIAWHGARLDTRRF